MLVMLFALAIPAAAAPEGANTDVKIVVDGKDLTSQFNEDTLWMEDGITMAGVRALGEAVGADVRYDSATGSVVVEGLKQTTGVYSLWRTMNIWWVPRHGRCPLRPMR